MSWSSSSFEDFAFFLVKMIEVKAIEQHKKSSKWIRWYIDDHWDHAVAVTFLPFASWNDHYQSSNQQSHFIWLYFFVSSACCWLFLLTNIRLFYLHITFCSSFTNEWKFFCETQLPKLMHWKCNLVIWMNRN